MAAQKKSCVQFLLLIFNSEHLQNADFSQYDFGENRCVGWGEFLGQSNESSYWVTAGTFLKNESQKTKMDQLELLWRFV